ncbi:hypothetical protein G6514_002407 [Epicoccum nigrum]|nr:hypothetical protein G6514_002407 [Epicoccum nigrum]
MPYPFVLGSTLLRTQRAALPRTFCRYKSITAAIEKGRGSGPSRFSGPRSSSRGSTGTGTGTGTRFDNDRVTSGRYEREDGRPSRPSRSKSSIGARRRRWEDEDAPPRRKELRKSGGRSEGSFVDRAIKEQDFERREPPSAAGGRESRFGGRDARSGGRDARPDRFGDGRGGRDDRRGGGRDDRRGGGRDDRRGGGRDAPSMSRPDWKEARPERSEAPRRGRGREDVDEGDRPQRRERTERPERTFNRDDDRRSPRNDRDDRASQPGRFDRDPRTSDSPIPSRANPRDRAPESLPYTTAASEFIYGYSSVLAAIRANRRQFYKLYVNSRGLNRDILLARAKANDLRQITREVGDSYDRAFDKASSGRPHNGFILEASPLPVPPITELAPVTRSEGVFNVTLGTQTREELAVNGSRTKYPYKASAARYPLILYLDGILDEGNLGAIARSAYVLGVDAIITPTRQSAPWSHIALKASAGAAEAIPIFKTTEPAELIGRASRNGWRCYAADAVPAAKKHKKQGGEEGDATSDVVYSLARKEEEVLQDHSPVSEHPTLLMMGAEGAGLKASLLNAAHYKVGIRHGRDVDEVGVDSLNVSVAAALLCHDMLRKKPVVERDPANIVF